MDRAPLIVIAGPTASGKSGLAVELAGQINGSVISADSVQIYRGLDIGSAKITAEEMRGVPHALLDVADPQEVFTVADYQPLARSAIDEAYRAGHLPILTGGTGFYIQAVVHCIDFDGEEGADEDFRAKMQALARSEGSQALYERLLAVDPDSAEVIHPNNTQRLIRALEYYEHTGEPFSAYNREQADRAEAYDTAFYVLTDDRDRLYERINARARQMVEEGLIEEVIALRRRGLTLEHQAMRTLGYKETMEALDQLPDDDPAKLDREALIDQIALHTRHYAKRQLTWFRREERAVWLSLADYTPDQMAQKITEDLRQRGWLHDA